MGILQAFRLALKSIVANKMRSLLTMLGMIIGVGAVIIIVGLMNGVTDYIVSSFADMGTNMLTVSVTSTDTRKVHPEDMFEFAEENADLIEGVSPVVTSRYTVKRKSNSITGETVTGVSEEYDEIQHITLSEGRFINYADILTRQANCVVGTYIVKELFDTNDVIGESIKIDGEKFKIVGIVEESENGEENSADDCIYIPYTKAARKAKSADISSYSVAAQTTDDVEIVENLLDSFLYEHLKSEDLYSIVTMTALLDQINEITSMLGSVLSGIAAISLVVAGIGIMNIMLVSVTERTREIGIRKSLGAKQRTILTQFIIEAGTISALGGLIGILLGSGLIIYLGSALGVNASPGIQSISVSFGISVAIGVLFGYMPAKKAARLNPIDALRAD